MFKKTIFACALVALTFGQTVSDVNSALGSTTVSDALSNPSGVASTAAAGSGVNVNQLQTLKSVTVGSGAKSVVITPSVANPTNNNWLNDNEVLNLEQVATTNAAGEWVLDWAVENGNMYSLINVNGDLELVDYEGGAQMLVANLGNHPEWDTEIADGAETLVDDVYMTGEDTVTSNQVRTYLDSVLTNAVGNQNVQGFLAATGTSGSTPVSSVVNTVASNPSQAATVAQTAAATNGGL